MSVDACRREAVNNNPFVADRPIESRRRWAAKDGMVEHDEVVGGLRCDREVSKRTIRRGRRGRPNSVCRFLRIERQKIAARTRFVEDSHAVLVEAALGIVWLIRDVAG